MSNNHLSVPQKIEAYQFALMVFTDLKALGKQTVNLGLCSVLYNYAFAHFNCGVPVRYAFPEFWAKRPQRQYEICAYWYWFPIDDYDSRIALVQQLIKELQNEVNTGSNHLDQPSVSTTDLQEPTEG